MDPIYRETIEDLYLKLYPLLFEYARSSLFNDSLAEEAVQETFRIACQKPESLCESPNPSGWLVNTLKFVILNTERNLAVANRILQEYITQQTKVHAGAEDPENLELLYGDLAELEEFQLLKEMAVDGFSHLQMAKKRNISVEACRKRVQRAKEILQNKIGK